MNICFQTNEKRSMMKDVIDAEVSSSNVSIGTNTTNDYVSNLEDTFSDFEELIQSIYDTKRLKAQLKIAKKINEEMNIAINDLFKNLS